MNSQPIHVLYGGADRYHLGTIKRMGELARLAFKHYLPDDESLIRLLGSEVAEKVDVSGLHARVGLRLELEPVQDFRIDFEDGYGIRSDDEEDKDSIRAATELAEALSWADEYLSPRIGIRVKSFNNRSIERAKRTLKLFIATLVEASGGELPKGFVVTIPKVENVNQVVQCVSFLESLESELSLASDSLLLELMIETPSSIYTVNGDIAPPMLVASAAGRVRGVHFGAYDYASSLGIVAQAQSLHHPVCQHARSVMQVSLATLDVELSDGATNIMPIAPNKDDALTSEQKQENIKVVHDAWRKSLDDITTSLHNGYWQGWDLHPAQIPIRFIAVYSFIYAGLTQTSDRLKGFLSSAAQATRLGDLFDDAATGQGLLNTFLRAVDCGALDEKEVASLCGVDIDLLKTRSFDLIVQGVKGV